MKKYRNFIIMFILSTFLGGFIGYLSGREYRINFKFIDNLYFYSFIGFLIIAIIIGIITAFMLVFLSGKYKVIHIEEVPKHIDRKINVAISLSTTMVILSMAWIAVMISKSFETVKANYVVVAAISVIIASTLQMISIRIYNKYYPDRKLNMFENNADKNFFERLDEGEKWIAYSCSYRTFKGMQIVYSIAMIGTILLSAIFLVPIILPIFIALMWVIQTAIYTIEAEKYNN